MSANSRFDWVAFYKDLVSKLLQDNGNRQELVAKARIICETPLSTSQLLNGTIRSWTVICSQFSACSTRNFMKEATRVKIIAAVAEMFGFAAPVPTSFDSIPALNNRNVTFSYFMGDREDGYIDDLWDVFESALAYVDSQHRKTVKSSRSFLI